MIAATRALVSVRQRRAARDEAVSGARQSTSTELVVIAPAAPHCDTPRLSQRPAAAFLAHLIATDKKFPQTRARNRAEPHEVVACYGAVERMAKYTAS